MRLKLPRVYESYPLEYAQFILGRPIFQPFLELLEKLSMLALNVSGGAHVDTSGEMWVLEFLKKRWKDRHAIIFDVGANTGEYALAANDVFGDAATIYAFEPSAPTFEMLREALRSKPNIIARRIGLGVLDEDAALFMDVAGSPFATRYPEYLSSHNLPLPLVETVPFRSLDSLAVEESIEHIDLLKLDVEGHEYAALDGARRMLSEGRIEAIQWEFGPGAIDSRTYFRDFYRLLNSNYRIYRILKSGLREIKRYTELQERFYVSNFLAVRREPVD